MHVLSHVYASYIRNFLIRSEHVSTYYSRSFHDCLRPTSIKPLTRVGALVPAELQRNPSQQLTFGGTAECYLCRPAIAVSQEDPSLIDCAFRVSPSSFLPMPSLFSRKKTTTSSAQPSPSASPTPLSPPAERVQSPVSSPDKAKSKGYFVKEREKEKRPRSHRDSKSGSRARKGAEEEHPLNFHPDDPRRWSALSAMSSSPRQENGGVGLNSDPMETTPAPETPGAFPQTNGVNGEKHSEEEARPVPPPHKTPASPPPQKPEVDAEACKAAGNKFYKAQQYEKAIAEYTKGE